MRIKAWTIFLFLLMSGLLTGCHPTCMNVTQDTANQPSLEANWPDYGPRQIQIMHWTEIAGQDAGASPFKIRIFVSLLDAYGIQIKSPGTFRFELYERTRRSAQIRGRRIILWDDVPLIDAKPNQGHWDDYLRAYEFTFEIDRPLTEKDYVLQATFFQPDQSRLTTEWPVACP